MPTTPSDNSANRLQRIQQSPHFKKGVFKNEEPTELMLKGKFLSTLNQFIHKPKTVIPQQPLPAVKTDLKHLSNSEPVVVWFGHSSYFISYQGFTILVDPVLQSHASPVSFFGKPFAGTDIYSPDDLPVIDLLIITHDHYDHLSFSTIRAIHTNAKLICTSLGVGAILESWGVPANKITELDWNETFAVNDKVQLTAQTARHFSGRTLRRNKTLWSAFVLQLQQYQLFIGGDSGYGKHFKTIGERYGPFDLAFLECGQYGTNWPLIHMHPEEVAQAAIDLGVKTVMPVHWAKFNLAMHPWNEPVERLLSSPLIKQITVATPKIGEPFYWNKPAPKERWWG
jgi:L-ascorbate metabolism protein UlaG (beta-lactamase superfamily)